MITQRDRDRWAALKLYGAGGGDNGWFVRDAFADGAEYGRRDAAQRLREHLALMPADALDDYERNALIGLCVQLETLQ